MSESKSPSHHTRLGQWFATAICGNDILSSALYVSGIAIIFAGVFAPLVLLLIAVVLFFYKAVYTEVVEALPVNGGAYNCLLNSTTKPLAAGAGVMTVLSYVATAVLSAKVGVEYALSVLPIHEITIPGIGPLQAVIPITIGLLLFFALLVISGLKDSAKVAFGIFIFHVITLTSFLILGGWYFFHGTSYFHQNLQYTFSGIINQKGLLLTLYFAFSASLLGVSGFESSANFVEEQKKGVFRKTLRNMLIGVAIFNPLIALVVLNAMPYAAVKSASDFLLADAARSIGGQIFQYVVVVDAFLVLSGAVLTSFIGVSGLVYRMASDGCLPSSLTKINKRGSFPRIVIAFFLLCSSIMILTKGNLLSLAGVYTIAFLGVMSLFALGNILLKHARTELKRTYHAPLLFVMLAFFGTFLGMLGNIRIDKNNLHFFELYFIPALIIVFAVIYQDYIFRYLLHITRRIPQLHNYIDQRFHDAINGNFIVFIHNIDRIHQILDYINRNETGWNVMLIHCRDEDLTKQASIERYQAIKNIIPVLQKAGVYPHLNITTEYIDEPFAPSIIKKVSRQFKMPTNRILVGSIHHFHPFDYEDMGGVRIII